LAISTHVRRIINQLKKFPSTNEISLKIQYFPSQIFCDLEEIIFEKLYHSTLAISTHVRQIINRLKKFPSTNEISLKIQYFPTQYFVIWKR